jgi:hypothetical protein
MSRSRRLGDVTTLRNSKGMAQPEGNIKEEQASES